MSDKLAEVLLVDCPDQRGLVHRITGVLAKHGANILNNDEFVDSEGERFFMRTEFIGADDGAAVVRELGELLPQPAAVRAGRSGSHRIVVLVTREHHCIGELLMRHEHGELGATIAAVIGNHATLQSLVERFGLPFHHVSHEGLTREAHEQAMAAAIDQYQPDYLVLAKYMRILSSAFITRYHQRIINIHHSFLPAFVGANPYRQAYERGVKIIGATAHFVTEVLDEGPIIAQSVVPVDHTNRTNEMVRAGRDVEKIVLATALKLVFDERVFLNGNRTVVFD